MLVSIYTLLQRIASLTKQEKHNLDSEIEQELAELVSILANFIQNYYNVIFVSSDEKYIVPATLSKLIKSVANANTPNTHSLLHQRLLLLYQEEKKYRAFITQFMQKFVNELEQMPNFMQQYLSVTRDYYKIQNILDNCSTDIKLNDQDYNDLHNKPYDVCNKFKQLLQEYQPVIAQKISVSRLNILQYVLHKQCNAIKKEGVLSSLNYLYESKISNIVANNNILIRSVIDTDRTSLLQENKNILYNNILWKDLTIERAMLIVEINMELLEHLQSFSNLTIALESLSLLFKLLQSEYDQHKQANQNVMSDNFLQNQKNNISYVLGCIQQIVSFWQIMLKRYRIINKINGKSIVLKESPLSQYIKNNIDLDRLYNIDYASILLCIRQLLKEIDKIKIFYQNGQKDDLERYSA